jgi:PPE-repeat protein
MSVVDFAALPPEINSGRMYAGAGSGSLVAAAASWEGLASQLGSAAASYRAVVSELTGTAWVGPSSMSMAAAVTPYVAWMSTTAAQAEQTASQLTSAVAAYEAAFTATVPPPIIAANRALLTALVATNIVGQNTPAIAATEAHYAEMWAQDAAAMYGYAGASAAATTVSPFNPPPQTTNPAGTGTQAAARATAAATSTGTTQSALSQVPNTLQSLASGGPSNLAMTFLTSGPVTDFEAITTAVSPYSTLVNSSLNLTAADFFIVAPVFDLLFGKATALAIAPGAAASAASTVSPAAAGLGTLTGSYGSGAGGAGVSAGLGQAASVGGLSVPQSWPPASPAIRLAATALPAAGLGGLPEAGATGLGAPFGGMPMMGGMVNASRYGAAGHPSESRLKVIPQIAAAPAIQNGTPGRKANAPGGHSTASARDELNALRKEIADLAKERDVLMGTAALLIKEALAP